MILLQKEYLETIEVQNTLVDRIRTGASVWQSGTKWRIFSAAMRRSTDPEPGGIKGYEKL